MNRLFSVAVAALISAVVVEGATAQWNVSRRDTERQRVFASVGLDPAIVTSVGYGHVVSTFGHDVELVGEVGLVAPHMNARDYRVRIGANSTVLRRGSVHLTGSLTFITRGTENDIYRGFDFGADATAALGVYRKGWFAAGEFGKDKAIITHLTHSDWYRTHFYPDAKDGWYLDAGGTYHYGVAAGVGIRGAELVGRFGWARTEDFNDLTPPFYAVLGVGLGL